MHAYAPGSDDVLGLVVGEKAFFRLHKELLTEAVIDGRGWFEKVFFRRDEPAVEQGENGVSAHHLVYHTAPIAQPIELKTFCFQSFEHLLHAWHLTRYKIHIAIVKGLSLHLELGISLLHIFDSVKKRYIFLVATVDEIIVSKQAYKFCFLLFVGEESIDDVKEVIVHQYFSEVEYQILYHIIGMGLFCY